MTRVAALDVGTNTVLLTIASRSTVGELSERVEFGRITRLGQDVTETAVLHPQAVERTLAALEEAAALVRREKVEVLTAVGTSALRQAGGAPGFLTRAQAILGVPLEVISGEREAELSYRGALYGFPIPDGRPRFMFDIGGGSTELAFGVTRAVPLERESLPLGSVRLWERFGRPTEWSASLLRALDELVAAELERSTVLSLVGAVVPIVVGVAGTVLSLAAVARGLSLAEAHGVALSSAELYAVSGRLARLSLVERQALEPLAKGRADVIICGAAIACALLRRVDPETKAQLFVSSQGVRYGLLLE